MLIISPGDDDDDDDPSFASVDMLSSSLTMSDIVDAFKAAEFVDE